MMIADALDIYGREHAPTTSDPARIGYAVEALLPFWGKLTVSTIKKETCRRYGKSRVSRFGAPIGDGTIRRELGVLRAALQYCQGEGYLLSAPTVTLPEKPTARERWLTRDEVARLIRAARASVRGKHLARFILMGVYTGSRKEVILGLRFRPHAYGGWVNTDAGLLYRRAEGERETKKRKPAARLPNRILAHLRRWEAMGGEWVVQYQGVRCGDIKTGWAAICADAGLADVTRHTLRHTAITWAMQNGADIWEAAGYFGASPDTIESVYGHHSESHQEGVRKAFDKRESVRDSVRRPSPKNQEIS